MHGGAIVVDDHFQTTAPGVYAAGDVIGPPALASASMEQGRVAACYALGIPFKKTVDPLVPFGVYAIPECAMVGLTEEQATAEGRNYAIGTSRFVDNSRAAIAGTTDGMVKLLIDGDSRDCSASTLSGRAQPSWCIWAKPSCISGGRSTTSSMPPSTYQR